MGRGGGQDRSEPGRGGRSGGGRAGLWVLVLLAAAVGAWLFVRARGGGGPAASAAEVAPAAAEDVEAWNAMVRSELVIDEDLRPPIKALKRSFMNLALPDAEGVSVFEPGVTVVGLTPERERAGGANDRAAVDAVSPLRRAWAVDAAPRSVRREELRLFEPFLDEVDYFVHVALKVPGGRFLNAAESEFETDLGFLALARLRSGRLAAVDAKQHVGWRRSAESGGAGAKSATWRVFTWRVDSFVTREADRAMFAEVLDRALPDPAQLAQARRSIFDELIAERIEAGTFLDAYQAVSGGGDTHPGVSVVDFDGDGLDDVFHVPGWGRCMLLHNRGDGTFEDVAAEVGLDFEDDCTSAVFADFDNDGDVDAFLGRSYRRSLFLVNEEGRFVDRTAERVDGELPFLTSSLSAADYDGDGLLDLYASTNGAGALVVEMMSPDLKVAPDLFLGRYLDEEDARELDRRIAAPDFNRILNHVGPPNVLLRNVGGGRFELDERSPAMRSFRNTFQATWADYDADGDPDLYVANDWAPNQLFRNDGEGRFVDVAPETNTTDIGFGMGATWGDYDRDGRQDLYVSNMFSKAGRRVLTGFTRVDDRLGNTYHGNTLFRGGDGRFDKVSGTEAPALLVDAAGWSWGSQFVDVDSDGWLDLFALSGNFTAPKRVETDADI